ncbi:MAG TPA: daunorubicin ABC transporter ATP-binding protein, partial [Acidimicrobiia bacterium]
ADTIVRVGTVGDLRKLATVLAAMEGARSAHVSEGGVLLYVSGPVAYTLPRVFSAAAANGFPVTDLSVTEPTLEAVFITLTGKELRD